MSQVAKGFILLVMIAIAIFIIWCFVLGKCKGHSFGFVPPRPSGRNSGRKKQDDDDDDEKELDGKGSGSGGAGASGSGKGSVKLSEAGTKGCGFWDIGCKVGEAVANLTSGKTIFGQTSPPWVPEQLRVPLRARSAYYY